ncbi:TonB-dependent receptor [Kordiimonas sp.]|uniref:TonB-dependent receptor n=1 Tax=Kordiimonas sp. TaxID=1970157 RepID=UPI003A9327DE
MASDHRRFVIAPTLILHKISIYENIFINENFVAMTIHNALVWEELMAQAKYRQFLAGTSFIALATLGSQVAYAQNAPAQESEEFSGFEEITITASRRAVTLQDTALSVTAINPEEFSVNGLTKLRDVIDFAPGVHYAGGGLPTGNTITMRGVSQAGRASTVGIYLDDVPLGSSNSFAAGPSLHFDALSGDVERVELIKGPQGTLYGSSSMGGVVRYITKDPSSNGFEGNVKADLSATKEGGFNTNFSGRISSPIIKDKLGISVAGYHEHFDGFIDRIAASPTGAAVDVDSFNRYGIYAKMTANPTENLSGNFLFVHTDVETSGANTVVIQGPPYEPVNGPYSTDEGENDLNDEFTLYAGTLIYDFGWGDFTSSTSYQDRVNSNAADLVATFGSLIELLSGGAPGSVTSAPFTGLIKTERFVQEIRLTSKENQSFEWSIGGIYSDEDSSNIQRLEGFPSGFLALDVDLGSGVEEFALFGNGTYYLNDNFDVTVGARLAWIDSAVSLIDGPGLIVANLPETSSSDTVDTYSFTARYRPNPDLSLYARVASGYRPENANLPLLDASGNNAAPAIIATDTLWSYEVGAKGALADSKVNYDMALWYIDWSNLQVVTFVNGASTGGNANSDVTAYGFEGSLSVQVSDGFQLISSLSYSHSTLDDDETAGFGALAGENMHLLPEWTASIRGTYDFPLTDKVDGFVNAGVRYVGSKDTGYEGGVGEDGTTITPLIANFPIEDYVTANVSFGIRIGSVTASIYARNIFDKYAFTGGSARPLVGFTRATANVLQPRTVGAVFKVDF